MADKSLIEWTDATWNPIRARNKKTGKVGWHCEHATTGCEHCYAEGFNKRLGTGLPFKPGHRDDIEIFVDQEMLTQPLRWKKSRMIFVCSMTDLFADFVTDEMLDQIFAAMALCPQHTFQVLTKRANRMRDYCSQDRWALEDRVHRQALSLLNSHYPAHDENYDQHIAYEHQVRKVPTGGCTPMLPLPNVWLGVSAERQAELNEREEDLRYTPASVRFLSCEPLLGSLDARRSLYSGQIHWVIVGGESGPSARPMHPAWARGLRDQCAAAGVAFFFKQWGQHQPVALKDNHQIKRDRFYFDGRSFSFHQIEDYALVNVGKKTAGRKLDGVEHNGFPPRLAS